MRWKHIQVKIIPAEGHKSDSYTYTAPPRKEFTPESEEQVIEKVIEFLDKKYPYWNFRMVRVGKGKLNFIYDGLREDENDSQSVHESESDGDLPAVPQGEVS